MPVINLPQDTRWGDLGQGLGKLIGGALAAYQQKQVATDIGQMQSDPNIAPADLAKKVAQKYGNTGIAALAKLTQLQGMMEEAKTKALHNQFVDAQLKQAQGGTDAAGPQIDARAKLYGVTLSEDQRRSLSSQYVNALLSGNKDPMGSIDTALRGASSAALNPLRAQEMRGNIAMQPSRAAVVAGEAARQPALTTTAEATAQAAPTKVETAKVDLQRKQNELLSTAPMQISPAAIKDAYPSLTDEQAQAAAAEGVTKGSKGVTDYIAGLTKATGAQEARQAAAPAPTDVRKDAAASRESATSAARFAKEFLAGGAQQLGLARGANAKVFLERHGIPTGDSQLVDMWNSSYQQIASTATTGGGFFSAGRVKLAKDVTADITGSPLHSAITLDQTADRQIARFENMKLGVGNNPQAVRQIDDTIKSWRDVKDSLDLHSYVTKRGTSVVMVGGQEVNPKTFKPVFDGRQTYSVGPDKMTGADVMRHAEEAGVTPEEFLRSLRAVAGAPQGAQ